jgi:cytochrome c oxidase subunit 4|tara:strand:- start:6353 stop:6790 length:438 start_codon:yes stop_codon:yes gene_type:complete
LSILKDLFHYNGNGWWRIPKTSESKTNPQYEHPFGKFAGMSKDFWTFITSGKGHASPAYYWAIAIILGLITMIEVWWFDVDELRYLLVPAMLFFSLVKFILVVAFFMHLKFDNKLYSTIFVTCMVIGVFIFSLFLVLSAFHGLGN